MNNDIREALRIFIGCAIPVSTEIDSRGHTWCEAYLDEALPKAREALAALEREGAGEQGWYCAHCQKAVQPVDVTYEEAHTECGRIITNDTPPAAEREGAVLGWIYEDDLPEGYPYAAMFPYSKVDGVRMFPVYGPADAQDAARLEWLISAISRDTFRDVTGYLSSRDNMDENRAAIDKQRGAGGA